MTWRIWQLQLWTSHSIQGLETDEMIWRLKMGFRKKISVRQSRKDEKLCIITDCRDTWIIGVNPCTQKLEWVVLILSHSFQKQWWKYSKTVLKLSLHPVWKFIPNNSYLGNCVVLCLMSNGRNKNTKSRRLNCCKDAILQYQHWQDRVDLSCSLQTTSSVSVAQFTHQSAETPHATLFALCQTCTGPEERDWMQ